MIIMSRLPIGSLKNNKLCIPKLQKLTSITKKYSQSYNKYKIYLKKIVETLIIKSLQDSFFNVKG